MFFLIFNQLILVYLLFTLLLESSAITPFVSFDVFILPFPFFISSKQFCKKIYNWPCLPCLLEKINIYKNLPKTCDILYWQKIFKTMTNKEVGFNKIIYFIELLVFNLFVHFFLFNCEAKRKKCTQRKKKHAGFLRPTGVEIEWLCFSVTKQLKNLFSLANSGLRPQTVLGFSSPLGEIGWGNSLPATSVATSEHNRFGAAEQKERPSATRT